MLLNGSLTPPPLDLLRGVAYRLRFMNITTGRPGIHIEMLRDGALGTWIPLAKDGADLPPARHVVRPALQPISIGETVDFEVTPASSGMMRLEVRTGRGTKLGEIQMRVH